MVICLYFSVAMVKVLFAYSVLYIIVHQHGHCETDMHRKLRHMKLLYKHVIM